MAEISNSILLSQYGGAASNVPCGESSFMATGSRASKSPGAEMAGDDDIIIWYWYCFLKNGGNCVK
jgi:hypothetical protein